MKILIPEDDFSANFDAFSSFYPLLDADSTNSKRIIGTELQIRKAFLKLPIKNIAPDEYQFRTDIVSVAQRKFFTSISNTGNKGPRFLMVEAQLSQNIQHHYGEFTKFEIFEILNNAIKLHLNMVPHRITHVLQDEDESNLFDNLEILKGQTMCDYIINNPSILKKSIDAQIKGRCGHASVVQEMLEQRHARVGDDHKLKQCLINHDLLSEETNKMINDVFLSNPLSKCFELEHQYPASADILIEYCLTLPRSKCMTNIFM